MVRGYRDRHSAGRALAELLTGHSSAAATVLALPRGGVPVAAPVAEALAAPLGVVLVRKIGAPGHRELAVGAVALAGGSVLTFRNEEILDRLGVSEATFSRIQARAATEARELLDRWGTTPPDVSGRVVIVVDDGLATGSTMMAAVRAVRSQQPSRIVVAVPVAAGAALDLVRSAADEVVCPLVPRHFGAVGAFYDDFTQTTDREVTDLLSRRS